MAQYILYIMAAGALLGGIDHLLGNRWGYGRQFEQAMQLLGPLVLSTAGILCLSPLLSSALSYTVAPLLGKIGMDPAILGCLLPIDMGGYQMGVELAADPAFGRFSGIVIAAIFGCTVVFTLPVGLGMLDENGQPAFTKGILLGMAAMPVGLLAAGLLYGLTLLQLLWNCLPVFLLSIALLWGLARRPQAMAKAFRIFALLIQKLSIAGLAIGVVVSLCGFKIPGMIPLEEAMAVVCSIIIAMAGSMPLAELLQRLLKRPFALLGKYTGLNSESTAGLLIGMVSVAPALALLPKMNARGRTVCGAFVVCAASTFAAHLGFTVSMEPALTPALLMGKLLGGAAGMVLALAITGKEKGEYKEK